MATAGVVLAGEVAMPVVVHVEDGGIIAVVDGMGGHAGGASASRLIAGLLAGGVSDALMVLEEAQRLIYNEMTIRPALTAMGATVAGVQLLGDEVFGFNVGDARVYMLVGGMLSLLSTDDRVPGSDGRLTQTIGGTATPCTIAPHSWRFTPASATRFLLCTDGLCDCVDDETIELLLGEDTARAAAHRLVGAALDNGASDNVSVVVFDVPGVTAPKAWAGSAHDV